MRFVLKFNVALCTTDSCITRWLSLNPQYRGRLLYRGFTVYFPITPMVKSHRQHLILLQHSCSGKEDGFPFWASVSHVLYMYLLARCQMYVCNGVRLVQCTLGHLPSSYLRHDSGSCYRRLHDWQLTVTKPHYNLGGPLDSNIVKDCTKLYERHKEVHDIWRLSDVKHHVIEVIAFLF